MKIKTILALSGLTLLCSCKVLGLKKQVVEMEERGAVTVRISPAPDPATPTYAVAWTIAENGTRESVGFQRVNSNCLASFCLLTNRTYRVGAFTDENGNGEYDPGEPMDYLQNVQPVPLGDPNARGKVLPLVLRRENDPPPGTVIKLPRVNTDLGDVLAVALGEVVSLDDPRFSGDTGDDGLWRPLDYLSENRTGIYFTEPYDPKRIPVIFVYGIGGSAQDWAFMMAHFDRSRYQLWFLQYPTGMRLSKSAGVFATGVRILQERYGFTECDVVAHSMGGLVAGAGIREAVRKGATNLFPRFVSISTPWAGHQAVESGIRHFNKPVPAWLDVRPGSDFLLALYATPLPAGTRHDLIYGEKTTKSMWIDSPNDGVVTLQSELDSRIKKHAASVTRFPEDHVGILNEQATVDEVLKCLQPQPGVSRK